MGRGRKPMPQPLQQLLTKLGQVKQEAAEQAAPPEGPGGPPLRLTAAQREVWIELVGDAPPGLLRRSHRPLLVEVAIHEVLKRRCVAAVEKKGAWQKDHTHGGTERTAPWVKALQKETELLARLYTALGFALKVATTPTTQQPEQPPEPPSELESMLRELDARDMRDMARIARGEPPIEQLFYDGPGKPDKPDA